MMGPCECLRRNCKHLLGIKHDAPPEENERWTCRAFHDGIPDEIAFGDNEHTTPYPGDNGIQYEEAD